MADFQFTDLTYWDIQNALPSFPAEIFSLGFSEYPLDPFGADITALTLLEATMSNFPPLFLRPTTGGHERLLPADGGLQIDAIDAATVNSPVELFKLLVTGGGGSFKLLESFAGNAACGAVGGTFGFLGGVNVAQALDVTGASTLRGTATLGTTIADSLTINSSVLSNVVFKASANHVVSCNAGEIKVQTTGSGDIWLTTIAALKLQGVTSVTAAASGGSMSFTATTTGLVQAGGASDLTFGARGQTTTLNQATATNLSGFAGTITSIIGALNDLRGDVHSSVPSAPAGESITVGDLVCLDESGGVATVYRCDNTNATRNRPVGVALNTVVFPAPGGDVRYTTVGQVIINSVIGAGVQGDYVFMSVTGTVTTAVPGSGTIMIVGIVAKIGAAGTAEIIYQPLVPTTF